MRRKKRHGITMQIGKIETLIVARDGAHLRGDPPRVNVTVDEIGDACFGGDLLNSKAKARKRRKAKRQLLPPAIKAITHAVISALSVGGMVAASGIAYALGWS
jgi:hypothetical protein